MEKTLFDFLYVKKLATIAAYYKGRSGYLGPKNEYEQSVLRSLGPGMSLLDVGCGRTFPMARKWMSSDAEIHGVDPVADQLAVPEGVFVTQGSAEKVPYEDKKFDIIASCAVFEHLERPSKVFHEFYRVLKDGGKVIILTPSKYDYVSLFARIIPNRLHSKLVNLTEGRDAMDTFPTFYRANSGGQLRKLAGTTGFEIQQLDYLDQSPYAFRFFLPLYFLAYLYHKVVRSISRIHFLSGWILCILKKQ